MGGHDFRHHSKMEKYANSRWDTPKSVNIGLEGTENHVAVWTQEELI
jgi:hypothetical protein